MFRSLRADLVFQRYPVDNSRLKQRTSRTLCIRFDLLPHVIYTDTVPHGAESERAY